MCEPEQPARSDPKRLCVQAGFQPGQLYELIHRARDPLVLGVGFAATRDLGAYLRNPGKVEIIGGSSQSGRMIRSFLALGFNQDETGQRVFDGAYPHIGGGLVAR